MSVINSYMYPRLISIAVPYGVPVDDIGDYVTDKVGTILNEIGTTAINPKSVYVKCIGQYFYLLGFDTNNRYKVEPGKRERFAELTAQREATDEFFRGAVGQIAATTTDVPSAPQGSAPADSSQPVDGKKQSKVAKG
jgi:hypothetical protein